MNQRIVLISLILTIVFSIYGLDNKFIRVISQTKAPIANNIKLVDQYAYIYNDWYLYIYSTKNPWSPQIETAFITTNPITDVLSLDYNHVFICSHEPANDITEIDSLNTFGKIYFAQKLTCDKARREGSLLYTTSTENGLQIFDIGKSVLPQPISKFSENWGIVDLEARYPIVHALNDFGYVNIDINDLVQPRSNGTNYEFTDGKILCVNRNIAWVGANSSLIAIDISDPKNPIIINRYRFTYDINDIKARGDELFVALNASGLKIIDITNPKNIVEKNNFPFKTAIRSIAVDGDYVYIAAGISGWIILEYR